LEILFDPMTEKVISTQKQKFSLVAGKTIGMSFQFTVSDKYEILGCRMIADSGTFSDGEQQLLPVLSNKEHLVETLPMPVRGEETRTFSLDHLFNQQSRVTIPACGLPVILEIEAAREVLSPTRTKRGRLGVSINSLLVVASPSNVPISIPFV